VFNVEQRLHVLGPGRHQKTGQLAGAQPQRALDLGIAHGALAMTTPGDTSMASLKEVEAVVNGEGARVQR